MRASSLLSAALVVTLVTLASAVRAEDASGDAARALAFSVSPGTSGGPWTMKVQNTGEAPLRLAADPHLLVLEVTPPAGTVLPGARAAKATTTAPLVVTCSLPDDARPKTDEGQELVVPAKRSWSTSFDPLLYCFDARARAALVPGATVRARFGWTTKATKTPIPPAPPFVASPIGASDGKLAPSKLLEATAFTLTDEQRPLAGPPPPASGPPGTSPEGTPAEEQEKASGLVLTSSSAVDVARGVELPVTVTLGNEGSRAHVLSFRPELIRFRVSGPAGTVSCGSTVERASPIKELFATLGPRGRASQTVLLTAQCPPDTFDKPGLYRATAILDTSLASGRSIGLRTFDGVVTAATPTLVRVRTPRRTGTTPPRPALD